jgi:hypothetical protein
MNKYRIIYTDSETKDQLILNNLSAETKDKVTEIGDAFLSKNGILKKYDRLFRDRIDDDKKRYDIQISKLCYSCPKKFKKKVKYRVVTFAFSKAAYKHMEQTHLNKCPFCKKAFKTRSQDEK